MLSSESEQAQVLSILWYCYCYCRDGVVRDEGVQVEMGWQQARRMSLQEFAYS